MNIPKGLIPENEDFEGHTKKLLEGPEFIPTELISHEGKLFVVHRSEYDLKVQEKAEWGDYIKGKKLVECGIRT